MRLPGSLLAACCLLARPTGARADGPSAESYLDTAQQLAAHGHCDEALRLRPIIERLDPELARTRFVSDPAIAACLAGAPAEPPDPTLPSTPPAPPSCGQLGAYMEPSILVAMGTPGFGVLARYALGIRLIDCAKDGHEGFVVRLGGTFSLRSARLGFGPTSGAGGGAFPAGGGELEATYPFHGLRLGVRAGIEDYDGLMTTVGVRVRDHDGDAALAIDGFWSQSTSYSSLPQTSDGGVMIGAAYGIDVGIGGFLGGLALAGLIALVGAASAGGN